MSILENIILALASAIVLCDLIEMFPTEKLLKFKKVNFDTNFFIQYMNDNTQFTFLISDFDKAIFVPMDDKRFVIMVEQKGRESYREMIFEPFYYVSFSDFRKHDSHIFIDKDANIFKFGGDLIYEARINTWR